jgi:hypothetical protein
MLTFDPKIISSHGDMPAVLVHSYNFPLVIVIEELAQFLERIKEDYKPRKYKRSRFDTQNRKRDIALMRKHKAAAKLLLKYYLSALYDSGK